MHLSEAVGLGPALDLHAAPAFERPGDQLLDLPRQADAEHHAVDDDRALGVVLDRCERDLGPERHGAHHLAAALDRRHLERGAALIDTVTSVPFAAVTRQSFLPSSAAIAARARFVASSIISSVRPQVPMPSSTEAISALATQVSLTAYTWAKRLAHSRLVMMMISSELIMA